MAFLAERALEYLNKARDHDRLAHAYLINGPGGSGKERLAAGIIASVNREEGESLDGLVSEFVRVIGPRSKSRRIRVDEIRELESSLQMAAPRGKTKVAVIREADRMVPEAENAFLKTLEEPPANCLLLLLTAQPEQLLPTILSRCIRIGLRAGSDARAGFPERKLLLQELEVYFREENENTCRALGLTARFTELLKEARAEVAGRNEAALKEETLAYGKRTEGDWLQRREEYYKALTESEYIARRNALVETLLMFMGDAMRQREGFGEIDLPDCGDVTARLGKRFGGRELSRRFGALERLRSLLETNTQEKLVLEVTFMQTFGEGGIQ